MTNSDSKIEKKPKKNLMRISAYMFILSLFVTLTFFWILGRLYDLFNSALLYVIIVLVLSTIILTLSAYGFGKALMFGLLIILITLVPSIFLGGAGEGGLALIFVITVEVAFTIILSILGYLISRLF